MNDVTVEIDGQVFSFWESVAIDRSLDGLDQFKITGPFNPNDPEQRAAFVPFSYKQAIVRVDGERVTTGPIVTVDPDVGQDKIILAVSGYAEPGVLNDCASPHTEYPLEFDGLKLDAIAAKVAGAFNVGVSFEADPGAAFDRVALERTEKALSFLAKLAKQRGLLFTNDAQGRLVFFTPEPGRPVAAIFEGAPPFVSGSAGYNGQGFFGTVTGLSPFVIEAFSEEITLDNPLVPADVIRPHTITMEDTENADLQKVTTAARGRMYADSVAVTVNAQGWRAPSGNLWTPGDVVTLTAPGLMVYTPTSFLIRNAGLSRSSEGDTSKLGLILPESYTGQTPTRAPWA